MNGSSAFSNILLPSTAPAAPKGPAPKVEPTAEPASENFRQHFDDARESSQAERKPSSDKASVKTPEKAESRQANKPDEGPKAKTADPESKTVKGEGASARQGSKKANQKTGDETQAQTTAAPGQPIQPADSPLKLLLAGNLGLKTGANATTDETEAGNEDQQSPLLASLSPNATQAGLANLLAQVSPISGQPGVSQTPASSSGVASAEGAELLPLVDGIAGESGQPLASGAPAGSKPEVEVTETLGKVATDQADETQALLVKFADAPKVEKNQAQATPPASAENLGSHTDEKGSFDKLLQTVAKAMGADTTASPSPSPTPSPQAFDSGTSAVPGSGIESLARGLETQTPAARNFVVQANVPVPVGQPQWSQAVGEKVLWLAAQNISAAEIHLHPKDLGPMQVNVTVNQDQANVSFTSHHPAVREVLDQHLGRLRDMFSEQGLNLVNVDVSDKSFQRQQGDGKQQQGQGGKASNSQDEPTVAAVSVIKQERLVDHYA